MSASRLKAFVVNGSSPGRSCWIQLPIPRDDFLKAVSAIGVTDPDKDNILVTRAEPELEVLAPCLKEPFVLNELNYFAAKLEFLEEMRDDRFPVFAANLQAGRHCGSVAEMINLLENLDRVELQPAFTPEGYGAFRIELAQEEYAGEMGALEDAENPLKNGFADYISDLERCLDVKGYGRLIAEREGGVFTNFGYLTETSPFRETYRGTQDIPAEFQASPFREAQPLLKLEQTDLTDTLAKIHGLSGRANDLDRNLETLHRRRSAEFLFLLTEDKAVLSEAMHVYREGTAAHNDFVNAAEAKMFSIYVTDFQSDFIGDIHEADASARRADILDNSIRPVAVEAETGDGERLSFTPEEWKNVSPEERDSFQGWTRRFADDAYPRLFQHIGRQSELDGERGKAVSAEQFFAKLEQGFPAKSAGRVPETRPKSVLARIAAARAGHASETPKSEALKHRSEPER